MTMDNGEGRPLDEAEAGNEDPQGWYFDLPRGAWERQEEKNRTLRERVVGNIKEDADKTKSDPFARTFELRPQAPPEPKKKGLFGFGKKKDDPGQQQPSRVEEPGDGEAGTMFDDDSADEWTTEPPLKLSPFPRAERAAGASSWGEPDGGWALGEPASEQPAAPSSEAPAFESAASFFGEEEPAPAQEDFASRMRAWAHTSEQPPAESWQSPASGAVEEPDDWTPEPAEEAPAAAFESPRFVVEPEAVEPAAATDEDFLAGLRAWANRTAEETAAPGFAGHAPEEDDWEGELDQPVAPAAWVDETPIAETPAASFESDEERPEAAEPDLLRLRPRARVEDDRRLDWNFGPAAWSDQKEEPLPDAPVDDESVLESMRKWAEEGREQAHPHFVTAHHDEGEADEAPLAPPPIPLRPRHADEHDASAASATLPGPDDESGDEPPRTLPIRLRARAEEPAPPVNESAKWNEFFGLRDEEPAADSQDPGTEDGDDETGLGEGLAAMRAWARRRDETERPTEIPEEFLKPFDWELQEDGDAPQSASLEELPAELLKPFAWEEAPEADEEPAVALHVEAELEAEEPTPAHDPFEAAVADAPAAPAFFEEPAALAEDDDLADIFGQHEAPAARKEEKKRGRFGRLFGRKKDEPRQPSLMDTGEPGDWVLPGEDESAKDIRIVAQADWAEDAGTFEARPEARLGGEGWGGSLTSGNVTFDRDALEEFSAGFEAPPPAQEPAPAVEPEWEPEFSTEPASVFDAPAAPGGIELAAQPAEVFEEPAAFVSDDDNEWAPEPAAFAGLPPATAEPEAAPAEFATDDFGWDPEPVAADTPAAPIQLTLATDEPAVLEPSASVDAVAESEPEAEKPWWEARAEEPAAEPSVAEPVASVDAIAESEPEAEKPWWESAEDPAAEPSVAEPVASVDAVAESEPEAETPWWEASAEEPAAEPSVAEPVASVDAVAESEPEAEKPWWDSAAEEPAAEPTVLEPVASVDAVAESEPEAEKPWWEARAEEPAAGPSVPEPVASVDAVAESEAEAEKPWWEARAEEPAAEPSVLEPVASVDAVAESEPEAETPWWEAPTEEPAAEPSVLEPAASVDAVAESEPEAEKSWWEASAEEPAAEPSVLQPVASDDAVAESEPEAETPWWEAPAEEPAAESSVPQVVASVDAVAESEPEAEKPWWEARAEEPAAEPSVAEPVASVDAVAESEPEAEKPWWEASAEEPAAESSVLEPSASVDAVAESEPEAEKPWWEASAEEPAAEPSVLEPVASVDAVAESEPEAEKPWWEARAEEPEAEPSVLEIVASVEPPSATEPDNDDAGWWAPDEEPAATAGMTAPAFEQAPVAAEAELPDGAEEDDPWADFVAGTPASAEPDPAAPAATTAWHAAPEPPRDEDMWGDIASRAEEAAALPSHEIDLAASLESQMAEESAPYGWSAPEEEPAAWDAAPAAIVEPFPSDDEGDVILAAFERHASTPEEPEDVHQSDAALAELFGTDAADIVAEATEDNERSFLRMSAWAPQRSSQTFDGGWAPEQEVEEAIAGTHHSVFAGNDGPGFAPPPWAVDEFENDEAAPQAHGHHRTKTWIRELVETGLLALLVFLSVRASFQNFKVEGSSMYPTLEDGQFLIVNKLVYSEVDMEKLSNFVPFIDPGSDPRRNVFHGPERGDIVVLRDPRNPETDLIKRVIGLPGETIEIVDGKVYINDHLLEEPYIKQTWHDTKPKFTIPPGEYFVMGDNRENSLDSRSTQVGPVPEDLIIGKAMLSYWPSAKFGLAPNDDPALTEQKPVLTTQRIGEP